MKTFLADNEKAALRKFRKNGRSMLTWDEYHLLRALDAVDNGPSFTDPAEPFEAVLNQNGRRLLAAMDEAARERRVGNAKWLITTVIAAAGAARAFLPEIISLMKLLRIL